MLRLKNIILFIMIIILIPTISFSKSISFGVGKENIRKSTRNILSIKYDFSSGNLYPYSELMLFETGEYCCSVGLTYYNYFKYSFGIGYYERDYSGLNLGYPIEFISTIEIYIEKGISFSLCHISNAGLGDINSGTEIIRMSFYF